MLIEFIGAPGSGKTTLYRILADRLVSQGVSVITVDDADCQYARRTFTGRLVARLFPQPLRRSLISRLCNRASSRALNGFQRRYPALMQYVRSSQQNRPLEAEVERRNILPWFENMIRYYSFLSSLAQANDVLLFDEAFVHRVVQFHVSEVEEPDPQQVSAYLDLIPRPDLIIFTTASPDASLQRVLDRGVWSHSQHKTQEQLDRFIANAHQVVHFAVDTLREKGWAVIQVDNSGDDPEGVAVELYQKLAEHLHTISLSIH